MPHFFIYLLKVNIALLLFYFVYHFALRRLTFYKANRIYLLFAIFCSALFPLVQFTIQQTNNDTATVLQYLPKWNEAVAAISRPGISWNTWDVLYIVYWAGVFITFSFCIAGGISLFRLWRNSQKINAGDVRIRVTEKKISPFTFWNTIFLNPATHTPSELHTIIRHERVHIHQWHTADILLAEVNKIFYWFNPGAWLMKNAIRENLEFIVDEHIVNNGEDKTAYQYTLLQTVTGMPVANGITSRFAFTHLKNRISMMNKKRTAAGHYLRYLLLLPLLAVVAIVFARQNAPVGKPQPAQNSITEKNPADTLPHGVRVKTNKGNTLSIVNTKNDEMIITGEKNGVRKTINWNTATDEEKKKWEEEFGKLPPPPPPPPPPPGRPGAPPPPPPPPPPHDGHDVPAAPEAPDMPAMPEGAKAPLPPAPPAPEGIPAPAAPPPPPVPAKPKNNATGVSVTNIATAPGVAISPRPVAVTAAAPQASASPAVTTTVAASPVVKATSKAGVATTVETKTATNISPVTTTKAATAY